jgi:dCTP deaminase
MILSDTAILKAIVDEEILISPFNITRLGSNSYDVTLSKHFAVYKVHSERFYHGDFPYYLDSKKDNELEHFEILEDGFILQPGILYLCSTNEYTETHAHVPYIEGKSSTGRLGIDIHATAGKGDVGFCGHWTLEISCTHPVKVYPDMPIGQLIYYKVDGKVSNPYNKKKSSKYDLQGILPVGSQMFKNF